MRGISLWLYLPRKEISAANILALLHELMRFQPTGFRSSRKARQFRQLGSKGPYL